MQPLHLTIEGMTCEHCVRAVDNRLRAAAGVRVERVAIGSVDVQFDPASTSPEAIAELINDEGYTAYST